MPRLSRRRVNPGARNIPYTIRGRRHARRARAWGLAADSGTNTGRQAPGMESLHHSHPRWSMGQPCHLPAAILSTPISQHTMEIILKPMEGLSLQKMGLANVGWNLRRVYYNSFMNELSAVFSHIRSITQRHLTTELLTLPTLLLFRIYHCPFCSLQWDIKATPGMLAAPTGNLTLSSQKSWNVMSLNRDRWHILTNMWLLKRVSSHKIIHFST